MGSSGGSADRIITEDMRAAAQVATEQWNDYQVRMRPFEDKFIADMSGDNASKEAALRGKVSADIAQQTKGRGIAPAGIDPSRAMVTSAANNNSVGKAYASGLTSATQDSINRQAQGMGTAVAMGRGQAINAVQTQQSLAETSAQAALAKAKTEQQADFANKALIAQGVGAAAGIGMHGYDQGWFSKASPAGAGMAQPIASPYGGASLLNLQSSADPKVQAMNNGALIPLK